MTLVELIVATSLGAMIMTGVLTIFLLIGRTSANIASYVDMEYQARTGLEQFAEDTRQASSMTRNSSTEINLVVNSTGVTYGYDATSAQFYRTVGGNRANLIDNISSFTLIGYKLDGSQVSLSDLSIASNNTKQIQLSLKARCINRTAAAVSNVVLSARYILRNKINTT